MKRVEEQRKKIQSVEVSEAKEGEGAPRRRTETRDTLLTGWNDEVKTLYDMFNFNAKNHGNQPCLGTRKVDSNGKPGAYEWQTYEEVQKKRDQLGSGIKLLCEPEKGDAIGIYSLNRPEWIVSDLACTAFSWASVSLYDTLGADAVQYIINHAEIKVAICASKQLQRLLTAAEQCPQLKIIIAMDTPSDEDKEKVKNMGKEIVTFEEVMKKGEENPQDHVPPTPEDIYTIMYTSGTTGNPKGVILTHSCLVAEIAGVLAHKEGLVTSTDIHMSYLPLAHSFERAVIYFCLSVAARIGFSRGIITELVNDIQALAPTFLVGAPRVWARIHDKVLQQIDAKGGLAKKLFYKAFAAKQKAIAKGGSTPFWDKIIFAKTKARLGGRVKWILSGSAPLDPKLAEFLKICFCCQVMEGYGLTETSAGAFITAFDETQLGHVGTPLSCCECKLVDVPEMNYSSKDDPPKGEICLRGPNLFKGYFKDKEKTDEVLMEDGWFHTGDIGRWNPNGTLSIIDRKKNIFKLAQGEYVAVEYLEGVYLRSKYVAQVWVYGNSFKRYLLAVVVPDPDVLVPWAKQNGISATEFAEICKDEKVKKLILDDLTAVGKAAKLQGFEMIKDLFVESEQFSVDNDLMTPSFKLRRPQLLKYYQEKIDAMYEKLGD